MMESFRKWFYRPKRDDKSLLAQFFYADEALNIIANELDSFDGRKDPGRCTSLVNQLRQSQDKVLTITNAIMDVLIADERANRDFRVKFPEDVLQENLAGQLWFGAECLAAGSSIMNKEAESTAMRPLAKAVTKSLENVRNLLRETCLRNNTPNGPIKLDSNELVTEMLLESLKIFDRLFAEFELAYVSAMVPVKTTQEYELQEIIGVLFSETLQRALKMKLLTQEMVDDCDPALMFTIPRLAIVSGLFIYPDGPLCIDKPTEEMSTMFRPFRTLLRKIRELLWTLTKRELYQLERLLCDNEQIGDVKKKNISNVNNMNDSGAVLGSASVVGVGADPGDLDLCDLDRFYRDYPVSVAAASGNSCCGGGISESEGGNNGNFLNYNCKTDFYRAGNSDFDQACPTTHPSSSSTSTITTTTLNNNKSNYNTSPTSKPTKSATTKSTTTTTTTTTSTTVFCCQNDNNSSTSASSTTTRHNQHSSSTLAAATPTTNSTKIDQAIAQERALAASSPSTSTGYLIPNTIAHDIVVASITDTPRRYHGNNNNNSQLLDSPPDRDSLEIISVAAATLSSILNSAAAAAAVTKQEAVMAEERTGNTGGGGASANASVVSTSSVDELGVQSVPNEPATILLESPNDSGISTENTSLDRSPSLELQQESAANIVAKSTRKQNHPCLCNNYKANSSSTNTSSVANVASKKCTTGEKLRKRATTTSGVNSNSGCCCAENATTKNCQNFDSAMDQAAPSFGCYCCSSSCAGGTTATTLNTSESSAKLAPKVGRRKPKSSATESGNSATSQCQRQCQCQRQIFEDDCCATSTCCCITTTKSSSTTESNNDSTTTTSGGSSTGSSLVGSLTSSTSSFNEIEIALALQAAQIADRNEVRAKYRSSEDLIHRLFVCIAGVADQLQTNFASDLRNILKAVFLMNTTTTTAVTMTTDHPSNVETSSSSYTLSVSNSTTGGGATTATNCGPLVEHGGGSSISMEASLEYRPTEDEVIENNEFTVDPNILAQEALFDTNVYFHLDDNGEDGREEYSNHPHSRQSNQEEDRHSLDRYTSLREDIATFNTITDPATREQLPSSHYNHQQNTTERPPVWIPDVEAPKCMSCCVNFTVVKRRHHCRNCGKVFCAKCSSNSVPLPKYGHHKPVRVCNKCFIYNVTFTM